MELVYFFSYPVMFPLVRLLMRLFGRLRSSGEANVPARGGFIYCPNHISDCDPAACFVTLPRRAWFIGKQELFEIPVVGWFFHHFHSFPIKRNSADRAALRRAEDCLKRGEPILIFPEGRCSPSGKLQNLMSGAPLLSVRTGCPIVPIGLRYTREVLPYGELKPRFSRHPVTVTFGPPLRPQQFAHLKHSDAIEALTVKLGEELARLTDQPPPPVDEKPRRRASSAAEPSDLPAPPLA